VEIPTELKTEEGIEMAIRAYRKSIADRKIQNMIHFREKAEMMTATEISLAREEGMAEGKSMGLAEGKSLGLAEGEARGEMRKSMEIACRLIEKGADKEEVKSLTGLSDEQLSQLYES
jgi:predicted transposase YdaD